MRSVAQSRHEILLVSPFIKLSLVKPLLLTIPDSSLRITVVTRFNKMVFQQQASDLDALALLRSRPGAPGPTRLFVLNRLHAKLYIFDRRTIFVGSSNLSLAGLERNFEMGVELQSPELAEQILSEIEQRSLLDRELADCDIDDMRKVCLIPTPSIPLDLETESLRLDDDREIEAAATATLPHEPEELVEPIPHVEGAEERKKTINRTLWETSISYLNFIAGEPAESLSVEVTKDEEGNIDAAGVAHLEEAAKRDVQRILKQLSPSLELDIEHTDHDALVTPFVHQSWSSANRNVLSHGLDWQRFSKLGRELLFLEAALLFARPIAFAVSTAGAATLAMSALKEVQYGEFLQSKGLATLLHIIPSLARDFQRTQVETILGLQYFYKNHGLARRFIWPLITDSLSASQLQETKKDWKTVLQETAQRMGNTFGWETEQTQREDGRELFTSFVRLGRRGFEKAHGPSKKLAEQKAAELAVRKLQSEPTYKEIVNRHFQVQSKSEQREYRLSRERRQQCIELAKHLGIEVPRSPVLLDLALTHTSYQGTHPESRSYLRLAFIGSFVVNALVEKCVIIKFGWRADHGHFDLDRQFHRHINTELLVEMFDHMQLDPFFCRGNVVKAIPKSIKRDVVQALFAVTFLWSSMHGAERFWERWLAPVMGRKGGLSYFEKPPTTVLQEKAQSIRLPPPTYQVKSLPGFPANSPRFKASCFVLQEQLAEGDGPTAREARANAAKNAIPVFEQKYRDQLSQKDEE
jgi:dsRNA-specific ribonuclease